MKGDFSKLKFAQSLDPIAKRLAAGASAVARKIEGTNEVRTLMRYDTHAARIAHGVPLFFTMSPDERHNLIMVRMSRSRRKDPVNRRAAGEAHGPTFGGLWEPALGHGNVPKEGCTAAAVRGGEQQSATNAEVEGDEEDVRMSVPVRTLEDIVPETDDRRAVLARDPLAGVDGFRVVVGLVFEYILGMRYCPQCPMLGLARE